MISGDDLSPRGRANRIAAAVLDIYGQLGKNGKPKYPKYTVLSALCLVYGDTVTVCSLATGTKCAGENIIRECGSVLVDSHAEVLCRRGLLVYLSNCILACSKDTAFEESKECPIKFSNEKLKFVLKEGIKLFLYTSDSPCGDAAVYSRLSGRSFSGKKARLCNSEGENSELKASVEGCVRMKPGDLY